MKTNDKPREVQGWVMRGVFLAVANLMKRKTNVGMFQGFIREYLSDTRSQTRINPGKP